MPNNYRASRLAADALLPLVVALVPLAIAPGILFFYDVTPKIAIFALGVAAALPWLAWPRRRTPWLSPSWFGALLGAQALSLVLSTLASGRVELSIAGTNWRRFGLIAQLALLLFTALSAADLSTGPERLRRYLRAVTVAAIPISLYGIAQYFGWDPWIPKQAYHIGEGFWTIVRPPGTLGYVSYFANYLLFAVFFGAGLYRLEPPGWWRWAGSAAAALAAFAIVLSGTRAAMAGLAAGAAFLLLRLGRRARLRMAAGALAGVAVMMVFYLSPAGQMLRSRARWYREDARGGSRILLWRDSLTLASRHWLVGFGPETFSTEFPRVQSAALARQFPDFYQESAHNILLDALTAQGLPGLLALAAFIGLALRAAWRSREAHPVEAGFLGAALIAALVAQQFTVFILPTALYFYLTVAMLVSLDPAAAPDPAARRVRLAFALPVSAALFAFAVRLLVADRTMLEVRAGLAALHPRQAAEAYQRARRWGLHDDLWYSRQAAAAAARALDPVTALIAWQQALESGFRATRTAEDPHNAWYQMAGLYARQNDFPRTEHCLREAIASAPNWFKPHWMLAQTLLAAHRRPEALAEAALAAELDNARDPEVVRTLRAARTRDK